MIWDLQMHGFFKEAERRINEHALDDYYDNKNELKSEFEKDYKPLMNKFFEDKKRECQKTR